MTDSKNIAVGVALKPCPNIFPGEWGEEADRRLSGRYEPDPNSGCWLWTGKLTMAGYGALRLNGKRYTAHRISLFRSLGIGSSDMIVMHSCDTPACINPDHLRLGTDRENVLDAKNKGRMRTGPRLSESDREEILKLLQEGRGLSKIAKAVGADRMTVSKIARKMGFFPEPQIDPELDAEAMALHAERWPGKSWSGKGVNRGYWRGLVRAKRAEK